MICPNCRSQIAENADFCPYCGTNIKQITEQLQPQVQNSIQQQSQINNNQNISQVQSNNYQQQSIPNYQQNNSQGPFNNFQKKKNFIIPLIIVVLLVGVAVFGVTKLMHESNVTPPADDVINDKEPDTSGTPDPDNSTDPDNSIDPDISIDPDSDVAYDKNGAFLMEIEDVFTIVGEGTAVNGRISRGTIKLNDEIQIIGLGKETITATVIELKKQGKECEFIDEESNISVLLKDVSRESIERGQVLAKPNSIKAYTHFEAILDTLSKEEGGRHTPFFSNYKPQIIFGYADIRGLIILPKGKDIVYPGEKDISIGVELETNVAMEVGTKFTIREGGRTIGSGKVTKLLN